MLRFAFKTLIKGICPYSNLRLATSSSYSTFFKSCNTRKLFSSQSNANTIQKRIREEISHIASNSSYKVSRLERLYEELTTNEKLYSDLINEDYEDSIDDLFNLLTGKIESRHLYPLFKIAEKLNSFSTTFADLVIQTLEINEFKDKIELSQFLEIITLSKEKAESKALYSELLNYFYFINDKQSIANQVLELDLDGIVSYLKIFSSNLIAEDQDFVDTLLKTLIESYPNDLEKNGYSQIKSLMTSLVEVMKGGVNFNILYDHYLPFITNDLSIISNSSQVDFIYFYSTKIRASFNENNKTVLTTKEEKFFKVALNTIEENGFDAYKLTELVILIDSFACLNLGSSEFFLGVEKHIGNNIDKVSCNSYLGLVSSFISSKTSRNKFLTLIMQKIIENRNQIELTHLTNLVFLYSAHFEGCEILLDNLHDFFCERMSDLGDEDVARLCKAYLTLKPNKEYLIFNDLEEIISIKVLPDETQTVIEYLEAFTTVQKGGIHFLKKLANRIFDYDANNEEELLHSGVQSLYSSISILKDRLSLEEQQQMLGRLSSFDELLQKKSVHFNLLQIQDTLSALINLGYENTKMFHFFEELYQIQEESENSGNESTSFLQKVDLLTKYQVN